MKTLILIVSVVLSACGPPASDLDLSVGTIECATPTVGDSEQAVVDGVGVPRAVLQKTFDPFAIWIYQCSGVTTCVMLRSGVVVDVVVDCKG